MLVAFFALVTLEPVASGTLGDLRRLFDDVVVAGAGWDAESDLSL